MNRASPGVDKVRVESEPSTSADEVEFSLALRLLWKMAPIHSRDTQDRPFRVHLTGFGVRPHAFLLPCSPLPHLASDRADSCHDQPFRDIKHNPSWLAVEPLDGDVLTEPPRPLSGHASIASPCRRSPRRPILLSTSLLPVEYTAVEHFAPQLQRRDQNEETPPPDLVIHVGVSAGDSAIRLEQRARKFGYNSLDAAGRLAPSSHSGSAEGEGARRGFVGEEWEAAPEELRTVVDADKVIRSVKSQGVAFISPSDDAGLSCLCILLPPDKSGKTNDSSRQVCTSASTRSSLQWPPLDGSIRPIQRPFSSSMSLRACFPTFRSPPALSLSLPVSHFYKTSRSLESCKVAALRS